MSPLVAVSLLPLDPQLSADLAKIAEVEGVSVLDLCRLVGERFDQAERRGRSTMDRQATMMAALRRLAVSYERPPAAV